MIQLRAPELIDPLVLPGFDASATRKAAWEKFVQAGLPTQKDEAWKYTDLRPLAAQRFDVPRPLSEIGAAAKREIEAYKLPEHQVIVLLNGYIAYSESEFTSEVIRVCDGESIQSVRSEDALEALSLAGYKNGIVIELKKNIQSRPIQLLHLNLHSGYLAQYRHRIHLERGSELSLTESYASSGEKSSFHHGVTQIVCEEGAHLHYTRIGREKENHYHIGHTDVVLKKQASFCLYHYSSGAKLYRAGLHLSLEEEGAQAQLNGFYLASGKETVDHTLEIEHKKGHTVSRQRYNGILTGQGRGVFNGKVVVREGASATDASQLNKTLLLSKEAIMDSRPRLEIHNDDVKCTHGATVGELEKDELFYLQTRGFSHAEARKILSRGFVESVVEAHPLREIRDWVHAYVMEPFFRRVL